MTDLPLDRAAWDVETERDTLASQLANARAEPGTPRGTDADVLALSLPPYFTACPQPDLGSWLAATTPDKHQEREYTDPGPFTTDISEGKSNPFYKAHSYPTKVPHPAIMRFVLHYTQPGDVVLDGFCGTGMTGVAAQACGAPPASVRRQIDQEMGPVSWGPRRAILADLSPAATFIAAGMNLPIDAKAFDRRSAEILEQFDAEWGWMYLTADKQGKQRPFDYVVWSEVFTCPVCAGPIVFYDAAFDQVTGQVADRLACPSCGKELTKVTLERRKMATRTLAGDTTERIELRPVAVHYRIGKVKQRPKPVDAADLAGPSWLPR